MGMFDWVRWLGPLPKSRDRSRLRIALNAGLFQSKSVRLWEDERFSARAYNDGCVTITVTEEGLMKDPDGNALPWSGTFDFYGGGHGVKWADLRATFKDGVCQSIERLPND